MAHSYAIVPAAGRSTRMARPKLLLPWGDGTVIEAVLAAWRASRASATVVVVHPDDARLAEVCRGAGAHVVLPDAPPPQMKDSVLCGLDYCRRTWQPDQADAWLLAPADMPALATRAIDALLSAWQAAQPAPPGVWLPVCAGRRGHPVLLSWPLADAAAQLGPDEGIQALVARHAVHAVEVSETAILEDLDSPHDYQRLRDRYDRQDR